MVIHLAVPDVNTRKKLFSPDAAKSFYRSVLKEFVIPKISASGKFVIPKISAFGKFVIPKISASGKFLLPEIFFGVLTSRNDKHIIPHK